jgi:hypothetical protein
MDKNEGLLDLSSWVRFSGAVISEKGWVLPIEGASADSRLPGGLRSVAARTAGMWRTAAGDDMIVIELWEGRTRSGTDGGCAELAAT